MQCKNQEYSEIARSQSHMTRFNPCSPSPLKGFLSHTCDEEAGALMDWESPSRFKAYCSCCAMLTR